MFKINRLIIFRYIRNQYIERNQRYSSVASSSSSSSSSLSKLNSTMKQLIDSKQYRKALNVFDQQSEKCSDFLIIMALEACTKLNDYQRVRNIQQKLSSKSLENPSIQISLIQLYMHYGDIDNAIRLFSKIDNKSNTLYQTMFKGFISNQKPEKVLDFFDDMTIEPDEFVGVMICKACAQLSNDRAKQIGMKFLKKRSKDSINSNYLINSSINMLMKFGDVKGAENLFHSMKNKTVVTYGAMMKGYNTNNMYEKTLDLFEKMTLVPHDVIYTIVFDACAEFSNDRAKQIGMKLIKQIPQTYQDSPKLVTSAIHMLMKFGGVEDAENLFRSSKNTDIVTYGAMMKGYNTNNMCEKALDLFENMTLVPNVVIYTIVFDICAELSNERAKQIGMKLLQQISRKYQGSFYLITSAIHMLMKFGDVKSAENLFRSLKNKDVVTYNAMMKGYNTNNMYEKTLDLFENMTLVPDEVTGVIVFNASAELSNDRAKQIGMKLLKQIFRKHQDSIYVINSVTNMLMKFGDVQGAENLFRSIKNKDIVTHGAMMKGYNVNNMYEKTLDLFENMTLVPNDVIYTIVFNACAQVGVISRCQHIIDQIPRHLQTNPQLQSAIIDMWSKAGAIHKAQQIFELIDNPDVLTYNSMINGYGLNGMGSQALELYRKMPKHLHDTTTHTCLLNACSHSGLLNEARSIFNEITNRTAIITTAMIDCLSRLYIFDEAELLMNEYEKCNPPYLTMYMAIISGLRNQRNSTLARKLYDRMRELFPDEKDHLTSASILVSNIYLALGDYEQAALIRMHRIKEIGRKVKPGLSWTEVNGKLVKFTAHDRSHQQSSEIYAELNRLIPELIENGYNPDSSWISRPLKEHETIQSVLCGHSERLAIGYNLIQRPVPSFIQVVKNLRVCGDCHEFTKLVAKIKKCDIIVRDANRIHHFSSNGQCSCQDHF